MGWSLGFIENGTEEVAEADEPKTEPSAEPPADAEAPIEEQAKILPNCDYIIGKFINDM